MEKEKFKNKFVELSKQLDIKTTEEQIDKFYIYMKELIEWNERINLTAITDEYEIILKHFIDSITILKEIENYKSLIDIGTGAGFPGIPIAIMNPNIEITLLDSLNKRIVFLDNIIRKLELRNTKTIHARAEDIGKDKEYREKFDITTSRAVAPLNVLVEYMLPFNKINGKCICMKGSNLEELNQSEKALKEIGGKINKIEKIVLPETNMERNIVVINKFKSTPMKYPRKAGTPKKDPII